MLDDPGFNLKQKQKFFSPSQCPDLLWDLSSPEICWNRQEFVPKLQRQRPEPGHFPVPSAQVTKGLGGSCARL